MAIYFVREPPAYGTTLNHSNFALNPYTLVSYFEAPPGINDVHET